MTTFICWSSSNVTTSYTQCMWSSLLIMLHYHTAGTIYSQYSNQSTAAAAVHEWEQNKTTPEYSIYLHCIDDYYIIIIIIIIIITKRLIDSLIDWLIYFLLNIDMLSKNDDIVLGSTLVIISSSSWSLLSCIVTIFPLRALWQMMYTYSLLCILSDTYIAYIKYKGISSIISSSYSQGVNMIGIIEQSQTE